MEERILIVLVVIIIILILIPPKYDPAIRLKEWLEKKRNENDT